MRNSFLLSGVFFGAMALAPAQSEAQWESDVRLTNNTAFSQTSSNNAWCIAASGDVVHAVWYDFRDGNYEIYYNRSPDGGTNWEGDIRLTNNSAASYRPSVTVFDQVVHVVWYDHRDGLYSNIYYKRSVDGGISWSADTALTDTSSAEDYPSIAVSGQEVHVVWRDFREVGNPEIYYRRSTNGGASWGGDTRLTNDPADSYSPSVSASGQVVHVVWYENRDGNWQIYDKRSTDGGTNWGTDTRLTNNTTTSYYPSVSVSGQVVHVVWDDNRDVAWSIYYKRSTDGGANWGADTRLTYGPSYDPSVSASGQAVHVVWWDNRDGNYEIYYKRSTDSGASWEADTRLTINTATSNNPSVSISGEVVHVVWYDLRDGNYEIYYNRDPTGNVVSGIEDSDSELPEEFSLEQNYPNPFNPSTKIEFRVASSEFVQLKIYDVLGQEVATLVNEVKAPGIYQVTWNATGLGSGVYLYRLTAGSFSDVRKLVVVQ